MDSSKTELAPAIRRSGVVQFSGAPSIRATLALLVVACVLPLAVVAALLVTGFYSREHRQLSNNSIVQAHEIAAAIDREIAAAQSALLALSTSHRLATGDLAGFHRRATEVLPGLRADSIVVIDRTGQILLSSTPGFPLGTPSSASTAWRCWLGRRLFLLEVTRTPAC